MKRDDYTPDPATRDAYARAMAAIPMPVSPLTPETLAERLSDRPETRGETP